LLSHRWGKALAIRAAAAIFVRRLRFAKGGQLFVLSTDFRNSDHPAALLIARRAAYVSSIAVALLLGSEVSALSRFGSVRWLSLSP
jgi:hypothetical protein